MIVSRIAVQFLAGWWDCEFGSESLAGFGGHNDEVCSHGKVSRELQRVLLGRGSRLRDAPNFIKCHVSEGEPPRNSVRSLAFQWNEVHQVFETNVNLYAVEFIFHARHCRIIVVVEVRDRACAPKLTGIAV